MRDSAKKKVKQILVSLLSYPTRFLPLEAEGVLKGKGFEYNSAPLMGNPGGSAESSPEGKEIIEKLKNQNNPSPPIDEWV